MLLLLLPPGMMILSIGIGARTMMLVSLPPSPMPTTFGQTQLGILWFLSLLHLFDFFLLSLPGGDSLPSPSLVSSLDDGDCLYFFFFVVMLEKGQDALASPRIPTYNIKERYRYRFEFWTSPKQLKQWDVNTGHKSFHLQEEGSLMESGSTPTLMAATERRKKRSINILSVAKRRIRFGTYQEMAS